MTAADAPSLARTLSLRVTVVAACALLVQLVVVLVSNDFDYEALYLDHITFEAAALAKGVAIGPNGPEFTLPPRLSQYRGSNAAAYAFRILDSDGRVIAAQNKEILELVSPWGSASPRTPDYWFKQLGEQALHIAGGRRLRIGTHQVHVESATLGDPAGVHYWVVAYETLEDVWLPVLPFALAALAVTLFSVRRALLPLENLAQRASRIVPGYSAPKLELAGLPREAAVFADAINGLMERVVAAAQSQKMFIASAAHELRTPLSVMLLELGHIDHPRARRLEADVTSMAESVSRLMLLARMDLVQSPVFVDVDIPALVRDTVERLQPWAGAQNHKIELCLGPPETMRGDPPSIREAVRNVVENAVRHTPAETLVRVRTGSACTVEIEDSGPGFPSTPAADLLEPFRKGDPATEGAGLGLAIARRAVELHNGSIEVGRSSLGGARVALRFHTTR